MPDLSPYMFAVGAMWYVVFLLSTVLHEAAHALAAKLGGDDTAARGGQVSLDPRPHIRREPFGMVIVPILTFLMGGWMMGWASAPYDPYWAARHPRRAAWMALAGPAANLALVIVAGVLIRLGMALDLLTAPAGISFLTVTEAAQPGIMNSVAVFLSTLFMLNLLLGFFNLLPVPPLDGSSGITLLMRRDMAERWNQFMRQPLFGLIGLLVAWRIFGEIFRPIRRLAISILYPGLYEF